MLMHKTVGGDGGGDGGIRGAELGGHGGWEGSHMPQVSWQSRQNEPP